MRCSTHSVQHHTLRFSPINLAYKAEIAIFAISINHSPSTLHNYALKSAITADTDTFMSIYTRLEADGCSDYTDLYLKAIARYLSPNARH